MVESDREFYAIRIIIEEYRRAVEANGPFHSAHEGYAVILEELDELWEEVKKKRVERSTSRMLTEATQVGAMALRFMVDVVLLEVINERAQL